MDLTMVLSLHPSPSLPLEEKTLPFLVFFQDGLSTRVFPESRLTPEGGFLIFLLKPMASTYARVILLPTSSDKGIASNSAFLERSYPWGKCLVSFHKSRIPANAGGWQADSPKVLPLGCRQSKGRSCGCLWGHTHAVSLRKLKWCIH